MPETLLRLVYVCYSECLPSELWKRKGRKKCDGEHTGSQSRFALYLVLFSPFGRITEKIRGRLICERPQM